jgi:hypothetical protein
MLPNCEGNGDNDTKNKKLATLNFVLSVAAPGLCFFYSLDHSPISK